MAFTDKDARRLFQVREPGRVRLRDHDPRWAGGGAFTDLKKDELKARAEKFLAHNRACHLTSMGTFRSCR